MRSHRSKDADHDQDSVAIARHLDANGPTAGDVLAENLGMTLERFWELINHPWFKITGKGWDLTAHGHDEWQDAG